MFGGWGLDSSLNIAVFIQYIHTPQPVKNETTRKICVVGGSKLLQSIVCLLIIRTLQPELEIFRLNKQDAL